ncbi:toxin HipA [Lysobacter concretionis Ko07 = DSM 16239]|uniref:Toxin HipA n=2 Tax=Novilysobacter TaxID=3382699 RepID=A0A0A0EMS6_9GAMM|nr:type II toxin-antitoxin system HipA family toxin [Lysobacter sp. CW239]KGM51398.1 toxin HipA [Lysobacter concretionis Ko07 = DSM 16239]QOD91106.1 type II toxin-antitoxin system HipA family toxin [Lysobacter sp. CW239]
MSALHVWMNGEEVALWERGDRGGRLTYAPHWLHSPASRPLSLSLPLLPSGESHRGEAVGNYFENLLPDSSDIRNRIRDRFGLRSTATFELLQAIGRDCVGAVQLLPEGSRPDDVHEIRFRPLDEAEVAALLRSVAARPGPGHLGGDDDAFRISIAGAQEKTGLLWHENQWCVPLGSTPSTHILKLPLGVVGNMHADMCHSIENEWLCLRLLAAFGMPVAGAAMAQFDGQRVLAVTRFDRRPSTDGRWWLRLPQEDLCQAFGQPPSRRYESDGGPGIARIMDLLRLSDEPADRATFFKAQLLFWLLAATDGHAKNFSLHVEQGGRFRLTPLYDVLSVYPIMGRGARQLDPHKAELAMAVAGRNRHRRLRDIRRRHWNETARACGIAEGAEPWIVELLERVEPAIASVQTQLPGDFPGRVATDIFDGVRDAARRLAAMPPEA